VRWWEAPVTTGPWNPRTAGKPAGDGLRACDADRERVIDVVKTAFVQGRLTSEELAERVGQALGARTYADLALVTADIPDGPVLVPPAHATPRRPRPRGQVAAAWVAVVVLAASALTSAFLTFYGGFAILFVIAFIGAAVTAQP
jgi:hypothetical protein